MKLHWSPRSPFVRKVMIVAHETGLVAQLDCVRTVVAITQPNPVLFPDNPLGKIPTLVLEDGSCLYDSVVICEYLDSLHSGPKLFPAEPSAHWTALRRHALGDGMLEMFVLWRNERERPHPSQPHLDAAAIKYASAIAALEREAPALAATPFGIGHIAIGTALSYLDFRFADLGWCNGHPQLAAWHEAFSQRASVRATAAAEG